MNGKLATIVTLFVISICIAQGLSFAEDIKEQMKARLPIIIELKAKGIVGENNRGYLEFRTETKEKEDVVVAENHDRKQVYSAIAGEQGTTEELVGQRRAVQIAQKAAPGEWIQDSSGKWYQKQ